MRNTDAFLAAARRGVLVLAALLLAAGPARAEKADRTKPLNVEANSMTSDDVKRLVIFQGDVLLTKGTIAIRADRIVVRQDADGFQHATATGNPVRFRQKGDPKDGREAVWTDGEALRVEIDDRNERIEMFERARVTRGQDVVNGDHILFDQRTEYFSVTAAKGAAPSAPGGRVKAVIQPKNVPDPK